MVILILLFPGSYSFNFLPYSNPVLKIALGIEESTKKTFLFSNSALRIWGAENLLEEKNLSFELLKENTIKLGGKFEVEKSVFVYSAEPIFFNNKPYEGFMNVMADDGKLFVVNYISTEKYLDGVLNGEISSDWPEEALKTQAIISRSYALYKYRKNKNLPWNLVSDTRDQVYGGMSLADRNSHNAIVKTYGEVVTHGNALVPTFFHSNSGGHTESAGNIWQKSMAYIKGKKTNYGKSDPDYRWEYEIPVRLLLSKLSNNGYPVPKIDSISVSARNETGRVQRVKISGDGQEMEIITTRMRSILGNRNLKSLMFDVSLNGNTVIFKGLGYGHGVGVCQWCAKEMAEEGMTAHEIIEYFYDDIRIRIFPG